MIYNVKVNDKDFKLEVIEGAKTLEIKLNGRIIKLDNHQADSNRLTMFLQDNQPFELELSKDSGVYDCWLNSRLAHCEVVDEKTARYASLMGASVGAGKANVLKAPMPGLIVKVEVKAGQAVKKGDGLVIVEAMKMENELKAAHSGKVKAIRVQVGQPVEKNQILIEFE